MRRKLQTWKYSKKFISYKKRFTRRAKKLNIKNVINFRHMTGKRLPKTYSR